MLKIENTEVLGWEHAIRGMRNPMNSWAKSDSEVSVCECERWPHDIKKSFACLGSNDLDLMTRLCNAGTDHRKFMRMLVVYVDLIGPLYWWKEFDTYKVGTVANSCSTMHKIAEKEFTLEDFSHEHLIVASLNSLKRTIEDLNSCREGYFDERIKRYPEWRKEVWWQMIQLLPTSYNQRRTVMLNYEVLANIYKSRRNHKLDEWHTFCDWIEGLPYSELITGPTIRDISISHQVIGPDTSEMLKKKFTKNAERNESHLLNGGDDPMGMTDNQYKGMLLDQLEDWQEILDLAIEAGNTEIQKKVEKQIAKINEKLKF